MSGQQGMASASALGKTRNGIILMMIGFAIGIVPGLSALGGLLQVFGIVLMVAGRQAIPGKHSRMVFLSLALLLLAIVVMVPADLRFSAAVSSGSALMSNFSFAGLVAVLTPYLYSAAIAYPLYFGSFLSLIYFVVRGWKRSALWVFYGVTMLLLLSMLYEVMGSLMALYSSAVTFTSVGQLSSALSPLTAFPSAISFIWLMAYLMAYLSVRGMVKAFNKQGSSSSNPYNVVGEGQVVSSAPSYGNESAQPRSKQVVTSIGSDAGISAERSNEGEAQPARQEEARASAPPSEPQNITTTENRPTSGPAQAPERVLFYKPSLQLVRIDQKKGPLNPGALVITDRGVYFLAKRRLAAASFLLAAPLAFATYKALTSADLSKLQEQLTSKGSFYAERQSLASISAKPSGWLSAGEIVLNFSTPITPYGSNLSGYSITLQAMGRGGGVALSQDDVRVLMELSRGA
ncbi:MAG: hypothetical protein ACP5UU_05735 [Thermoprotei archaeon]